MKTLVARHREASIIGAVHKVRHAIFGQFCPLPPPVTLCHTARDPPFRKCITHLGPPSRFLGGLVQKSRTKAPCTNSLSIVRGVFCPGLCQGVFCLEGFVRGGFVRSPRSEYICCNRKLNITLNFMFYMYDKKFINVTSYALYPFPCHKLSHLLGPPAPSSVTYFMDGPLCTETKWNVCRQRWR